MPLSQTRVFISYDRDDTRLVEPITRLLRSMSLAVFRDEDSIRPGKRWRYEISAAISDSTLLILFWCRHSAISDYVREEYESAMHQGKDVLPILLDDTVMTAELKEFQYIDFRPLVANMHEAPPPPPPMSANTSRIAPIGAFLFGTTSFALGMWYLENRRTHEVSELHGIVQFVAIMGAIVGLVGLSGIAFELVSKWLLVRRPQLRARTHDSATNSTDVVHRILAERIDQTLKSGDWGRSLSGA